MNEGDPVTLDGTASSDLDLDVLAFAWTQTGGPTVTLSDPAAASPTFGAPGVSADMTLTFSLVVSDGIAPPSIPRTGFKDGPVVAGCNLGIPVENV